MFTSATPLLAPLIVAGAIAAFVVIWVLVCMILSAAGGWNAMAGVYRVEQIPKGKRVSFESARIGPVNYNGCLHLTFTEEGLGLDVVALFRVGHPRLFVPWSDLRVVGRRQMLLSKMVEVGVGKPPALTEIRFREATFKRAGVAVPEIEKRI